MVSRCTDRNHPQWEDYGGRGITVCPTWHGPNGLAQFIADMHPKPPGKSLDRIDNDGPYTKVNCRWATGYQQQANTRQNVLVTHQGQTLILSEWARVLGIRSDTLKHRLKLGRPMSEVMAGSRLTRHASKR
jgi:hypothetical protein